MVLLAQLDEAVGVNAVLIAEESIYCPRDHYADSPFLNPIADGFQCRSMVNWPTSRCVFNASLSVCIDCLILDEEVDSACRPIILKTEFPRVAQHSYCLGDV